MIPDEKRTNSIIIAISCNNRNHNIGENKFEFENYDRVVGRLVKSLKVQEWLFKVQVEVYFSPLLQFHNKVFKLKFLWHNVHFGPCDYRMTNVPRSWYRTLIFCICNNNLCSVKFKRTDMILVMKILTLRNSGKLNFWNSIFLTNLGFLLVRRYRHRRIQIVGMA